MPSSGQSRCERLVRAGLDNRANATEANFDRIGAGRFGFGEEQMKVELFYIAECPNYREAARMLREALSECGFRDKVSEIEVTDAAQAQALVFMGSPSIRIEGNDIEPMLPNQRRCGLSCRTYSVGGKLVGVPPLDMIRAAICAAASLARTESKER